MILESLFILAAVILYINMYIRKEVLSMEKETIQIKYDILTETLDNILYYDHEGSSISLKDYVSELKIESASHWILNNATKKQLITIVEKINCKLDEDI